jgi:hypothetical protein
MLVILAIEGAQNESSKFLTIKPQTDAAIAKLTDLFACRFCERDSSI